MNLHDYAVILRRRWKILAIVVLSVLAVAAGFTLALTPQYTASTRLFFAVQGTQSTSEMAVGSAFAENQMKSYRDVATSPLVLEPVIRKLGLQETSDRLASRVVVTVSPDTVILSIAVTNPDRELAAQIANAVGAQVAQVAVSLTPPRADGEDAVRATIVAPAQVPRVSSSPHVTLNLALGLVLGLMAGLATALLRDSLDTKIRSASDLRKLTDSPLLGTIAFDPSVAQHAAVVSDLPLSPSSESIRRLRTNLQFVATGSGAKRVVVTSSLPGEGKSTTSLNLAVALADAGSRVVLVDADLRRPSIAEHAGIEGRVGLTTVLIGRAKVEDVIQTWQDSHLDILPAGQVPPNPSELLGSKVMADLLDDLARRYDVILLDSAPLLPVTDAAILSKLVGGALVIVGADRIHRPQLVESLETLRAAGAAVYGLVLNKVERRGVDGYGYGYGYQPDSSEGRAPTPLRAPEPAWSAPGGGGTDIGRGSGPSVTKESESGSSRWHGLLSGRSHG